MGYSLQVQGRACEHAAGKHQLPGGAHGCYYAGGQPDARVAGRHHGEEGDAGQRRLHSQDGYMRG